MHRYVHGKHAKKESGAKNCDNPESLGAANDPEEAKNDHPCDKDPNDVSH